MSPTPLEVPGVGAMGNVNVWIVPTIAGVVPTVAEITAAGALDITGFLYAGGWTPGHTANAVTAPRRVADTRTFQRKGLTADTLGNMSYATDPQAASGDNAKKAQELLVEDAAKFAVERLGAPNEQAAVIGDFVRWCPIVLGPQNFVADTSAEENEIHIEQQVFITTPGWSGLIAITA